MKKKKQKPLKLAIKQIHQLYCLAMDAITADPDQYRNFFTFHLSARDNRRIFDQCAQSWREDTGKSYVLDRWDVAYDGNNLKLLERNYGYLGLIAGTGAVQEDYAQWLNTVGKYKGRIGTFGNFQNDVISAFRAVADKGGPYFLSPNAAVVVTGEAVNDKSDPGMLAAEKILCAWIDRAGFKPVHLPVADITLSQSGGIFATIPMPDEQRKALNSRLGKGLILDRHVKVFISATHVFPFYGAEYLLLDKALFKQKDIVESEAHRKINALTEKALSGKATESEMEEAVRHMIRTDPYQHKTASTQCMAPLWSLLMGHKAMLAILFKMFPDHPALLPASFDRSDFRNENHISKKVGYSQGMGCKIFNAAGKEIERRGKDSRRRFGAYGTVFQAYANEVRDSEKGYRVFHVFTANGKAAAMGTRVAPGRFVGGDDTKTRFIPVLVQQAKPA